MFNAGWMMLSPEIAPLTSGGGSDDSRFLLTPDSIRSTLLGSQECHRSSIRKGLDEGMQILHTGLFATADLRAEVLSVNSCLFREEETLYLSFFFLPLFPSYFP